MSAAETVVDGWFLVELMGHRRLAGRLSEVQIAGEGFLRLDIPGDAGEADVATQFYRPASVYALTPIGEDVARKVAAAHRPQPVTTWELAPASGDAADGGGEPW